MKLVRIILTAVLAASAAGGYAQAGASADRFSPGVGGYLERARLMRDAGNYAGVIDQLRHLDTQQVSLSSDETAEYTFLLADAYYQRGDSECLRLLLDFTETYPASLLAVEAALATADYYWFNHNWPDALEAYNKVDFDRLNRDQRPLYTYRKALAMIKTGYFKEARPLVASLGSDAGYADAYHFYTGYLDYIDGKFNDAYRSFSRVTPGVASMDAAYYMAQIEYSRGDYQAVINRRAEITAPSVNPELLPEMKRITGLSYFKLGDLAKARPLIASYLESAGDNASPDALYAMGAIDYADGDYTTASGLFSRLSDQQDELGQSAWLYLGQCYLKEGNNSAAALAFEKAARLDFDRNVSEAALYNYATALTRGGKVPFSSSSELLERFVSQYPDSKFTPDVEAYLATAYYNDRDYTKALKYIDAIRNPSESVTATRQKILYELGVELLTNGRASEAAGYLRQAVALRSYDRNLAAQASLWLGDALYAQGRFADARKSYNDFLRDDKSGQNRALGFYDLAYTKYKEKNYAGAAADFASALSAKPALPEALRADAQLRRGDCLYYEKKFAEASALFTDVIDAGLPGSDYALYRRALLRGLSGDNRAKLEDLTRAVSDYPQSPWLDKILLEQAQTYELTGQSGLASEAYKKRLSLAGDVSLDELLRMAEAMHASGRSADLLDVTERIHALGGLEAEELARISLYEADAHAALGHNVEAEALYESLAGNPTSETGSQAAVALAQAALDRGEFDRARDLMESFTETGTPHQYWLARGFVALADAYHGLGDKTLAREYIISLRDNYPGDEQDISDMISSRLKKWK